MTTNVEKIYITLNTIEDAKWQIYSSILGCTVPSRNAAVYIQKSCEKIIEILTLWGLLCTRVP